MNVLAVCAVILLLRYMQEVLIPFVLAALTFYALDPMVDRLQRWRLPRALGAAVMLILVVGLAGGLGYSLTDDVTEVASELPAAAQKLRASLRASRNQPPGVLEKLQEAATEIDKTAAEATGEKQVPAGVVRVQMEEASFSLSRVHPLGTDWGPVTGQWAHHGVVSRLLSLGNG